MCKAKTLFPPPNYQKTTNSLVSIQANVKTKIPETLGFSRIPGHFSLAAGEGFEPSQTESESVVLPLHKPANCARFCRLRIYYKQKSARCQGIII